LADTSQIEKGNFQLWLPCEPTSLPRARARVGEWCRAARLCRDRILDIQLAVTEAATNAVLHSGCTEFEVRAAISSGSLVISVEDYGTVQDDAGPGLGAGIAIMRKLAQSVDFDRTRSGTRVTMRFGPVSARANAPAG
jgi:anti-sigma regulatory factor (Ser/Thr protein kinase)